MLSLLGGEALCMPLLAGLVAQISHSLHGSATHYIIQPIFQNRDVGMLF